MIGKLEIALLNKAKKFGFIIHVEKKGKPPNYKEIGKAHMK